MQEIAKAIATQPTRAVAAVAAADEEDDDN